jgi:hypothetical protein
LCRVASSSTPTNFAASTSCSVNGAESFSSSASCSCAAFDLEAYTLGISTIEYHKRTSNTYHISKSSRFHLSKSSNHHSIEKKIPIPHGRIQTLDPVHSPHQKHSCRFAPIDITRARKSHLQSSSNPQKPSAVSQLIFSSWEYVLRRSSREKIYRARCLRRRFLLLRRFHVLQSPFRKRC